MSDRFDLVFFSVLAITLLSGAAAGALAFWGPFDASPLQARFFDASLQAFVLGVGAVIGLMGRRML
ncbi:MAG TPA: hypothetical protein VGG48_16845 [Rhizomicrobium sp.]|jgi:hypothetical protein